MQSTSKIQKSLLFHVKSKIWIIVAKLKFDWDRCRLKTMLSFLHVSFFNFSNYDYNYVKALIYRIWGKLFLKQLPIIQKWQLFWSQKDLLFHWERKSLAKVILMLWRDHEIYLL